MKSRTLEYFISFTIIYKMSYLAAGLTAVGANSAAALVLNANARFNQVTTGASTTGVRIPSSQPAGSVFEIRNDVANSINVYPPSSGVINTLLVDAPYVLPAYSTVKFVVASSFVAAGPVTVPQVFTFADQLQSMKAKTPIAATQALLPSDAGVIFATAAAATVLTLPASSVAGLHFKIVKSAANAQTITVSSTAADIIGTLSIASATAGNNAGILLNTARTSVIFAAGALIGDNLDLVSTGTNWICNGVSGLQAGFTVA
jgi:hypothetical protein